MRFCQRVLSQSALYAVVAAAILAGTALYARPDASAPRADEQFFIISSVDLQKNQIVLKRPTEVTELLLVTDKTVFLDENGKKIGFQNVHAGNTVWVMARRDGQGAEVAMQVRKGPMTVEELHRRYLPFK
jgi:hypothetical protein